MKNKQSPRTEQKSAYDSKKKSSASKWRPYHRIRAKDKEARKKRAGDMKDLETPFDFFDCVSVKTLHERHSSDNPNVNKKINFFHLINPVKKDPQHELTRAQDITIASMRIAQTVAQAVDPNISVRLAATALPEDEEAVPSDFVHLANLTQTSEDVNNFDVSRRLPLIYEIMSRARDAVLAFENVNDTYVIFTNVDIGLTNHFYTYCAWLARLGYDFALINRRSIPDIYGGIEDLPAIMSDFGEIHPGKDCFIIKASLLRHLIPNQAIVGMNDVMRPLYLNMVAHAEKSVVVKDAHATFHLGIDSEWMNSKYNDYARFNQSETIQVVSTLEQTSDTIRDKLAHFVRTFDDPKAFPIGLLGLTIRDIKPHKFRHENSPEDELVE